MVKQSRIAFFDANALTKEQPKYSYLLIWFISPFVKFVRLCTADPRGRTQIRRSNACSSPEASTTRHVRVGH